MVLNAQAGSAAPFRGMVRGTQVPRIIHMLWLQGIDAAPDLVKANVRRWRELNPGYRINLLDRAGAAEVLGASGDGLPDLRPQAYANLVRTRLLLDQGGVWTDVSIAPLRPLDDWLPDLMTSAGFFAFSRPGPDRPLSNFFLVGSPDNPILRTWFDASRRFWQKPRTLLPGRPEDPVSTVAPEVASGTDTYPYFWHLYIFRHLLATEPDFAARWNGCATVSADLPRSLKALLLSKPTASRAEMAVAAAAFPIQKLNWRLTYSGEAMRFLSGLGPDEDEAGP